ncbi:hypothetical protein ScPMuIL_002938 [Solemya velum]
MEEHSGFQCAGLKIPTSHFVATGIKAGTFLLVAVLVQIQRLKGDITSGVLFLFWLLQLLAAIVPLQSKISNQPACSESVVYYVYFGAVFLGFLLNCFAEKQTRIETDCKVPCPEETSGVLSQLTFWWITPLVLTAYRKTIDVDDVWDQTERLKSENVVPRLEATWRIEEKSCKQKNYQSNKDRQNSDGFREKNTESTRNITEKTPLLKTNQIHQTAEVMFRKTGKKSNLLKPSLYSVLLRSFGHYWIEAVSYKLVADSGWFIQPIVVKYIVHLIEEKNSGKDPGWMTYGCSVLLVVSCIIALLFFHRTYHKVMVLSLRIKVSLIALIYKKALSMSPAAKHSSTVGEIVNLMSVDCQRIQDGIMMSFNVASFFFMIIIGVYQMWTIMGISAMGALGILLFFGPLGAILAALQNSLQQQILKLKGMRLKVLHEVIACIKVLKMYTWETSFEQKVCQIRAKEMIYLMKIAIIVAFFSLFSFHGSFMILYFTILVYVLTDPNHYLDAQKTFAAMSLSNVLSFPIGFTPFMITGITQAYVSVGRIQSFLWNEDIDPDNVEFVQNSDYSVSVTDGTFMWDREADRCALQQINMSIEEGQLVAIVGQVGAGKSSLISALLGEMYKVEGRVKIKGRVAYVPQQAWIQNLTVRDNILYGSEFVDDIYHKVVENCALLPDLDMFEAQDLTEIGEKGINISGGQKQRNVIGNEGLLKNKTRMLVTHGVHWLPFMDKIIVLRSGQISEVGSYEELLSHNGPFAQFLKEYLNQEEESDSDDPEIQDIMDKMWKKVDQALSDGSVSDDSAEFWGPKSGIRGKKSKNKKSQSRSKMEVKPDVTVPKQSYINASTSKSGQLIEKEVPKIGMVNMGVYISYAKAMGIVPVVLVFLSIAVYSAINVYSSFWLTFWTEDPYLKNLTLTNTTTYHDKYTMYLGVFTLLGVAQGVAVFIFAYFALTRMVTAAGRLHHRMLKCILRSPMLFFDTTPVGRMMNRFSSDIDVMDTNLPLSFRLLIVMLFRLITIIIIVSITTPLFLAVIVPVGVFYCLILRLYLPTAHQLKRLESVSRSPVFNHFSETISGASVIRSFQSVDRFNEELSKRVDTNCKFFFAVITATRWLAVRLQSLGLCLIFAACIFSIEESGLNGAEVGLSITNSLQITVAMNMLIISFSDLDMNTVSVERVQEYTELTAEADWSIPSTCPQNDWPNKAEIKYVNYETRYRPGLDLVLRGISFEVHDGEKVGIVGRTGAGKSSLTLSLFRLIEAAGGRILIDGVDVAEIGLHDLRSKVTILPQDPVIFSGSLRMNLDPFGRYDDSDIWQSLECAHIRQFVTDQSQQLEFECGEAGKNLSVGQRQLVCLARALLHRTKILILDEATAAVDMETDDLIQQTIHREFSDCTILTIAHRLKTVMDYDRIMVLENGCVVEFDSPQALLLNRGGVFHSMAKDANLI